MSAKYNPVAIHDTNLIINNKYHKIITTVSGFIQVFFDNPAHI